MNETEKNSRLVSFGKALSDPCRVQMVQMLAKGRRKCFNIPNFNIPFDDGDGICVCHFMAYFDMKQSKVSYHLAQLKEAGLIQEKRRGKWIFYHLKKEMLTVMLNELEDILRSP